MEPVVKRLSSNTMDAEILTGKRKRTRILILKIDLAQSDVN